MRQVVNWKGEVSQALHQTRDIATLSDVDFQIHFNETFDTLSDVQQLDLNEILVAVNLPVLDDTISL